MKKLIKFHPLAAMLALLAASFLPVNAQTLTEHEYAKAGDWTVNYETDPSGKFVQASMVRAYGDNGLLRMTISSSHFHLDLIGDWNALGNAGEGGSKFPVELLLTEQMEVGSIPDQAMLISDDGDQWLRISQSLDEPGGVQDVVRNGETLNIIFPNKKKWTFSLKGSHNAWKKVEEAQSQLGGN